MRLSLCSFLLLVPLAAEEVAIEDVLRRLDAESVAEREATQAELQRWCLAAGPSAAETLRARLAATSPEVRARIQVALELLARIDQARAFLERDELPIVLAAARELWRTCRDERGIRVVLARLDAMGPLAPGDTERDAEMYMPALDVLVECGEGFVAEALCRYIRGDRQNFRTAAIRAARDLPHPDVVRALLATIESAGAIECRIDATESLAEMFEGSLPVGLLRRRTERAVFAAGVPLRAYDGGTPTLPVITVL